MQADGNVIAICVTVIVVSVMALIAWFFWLNHLETKKVLDDIEKPTYTGR